MKTAIKYIQPTTIKFLIEKIGKMTDYREANELLNHLTGIDTFFRNQEDFLTLLELLKPNFMIREGVDRREYGDFQTPYKLTDSICSYLDSQGVSPDVIIEPTFGKGSFLISALKYFPKLKKIYGVEIYESYYWAAKFAIVELFIKQPDLNKPRILLYINDIFKFEFMEIEGAIENHNVLVLGNPPWVTNSELGILNSKNLPKKTNIKSLNGLDAITQQQVVRLMMRSL
jgi:type I restriction-modification system DNA methylase subunit